MKFPNRSRVWDAARHILLLQFQKDSHSRRVVDFLTPYRNRLTSVRVDGTGIGHNFGLHLRDQGFPVDLVKVGLPCPSRRDLRDNDPAERFANEKGACIKTWPTPSNAMKLMVFLMNNYRTTRGSSVRN